MTDHETEHPAPGWDAIDAAIAPVVGATTPAHFGTGTGLPDQDGLWGISACDLEDHWFLVTYGLTELFTKVSDDPDVSGWGLELTMRTAPGADPPMWAVRLLARLGELVFERSTPFLPGGRIEMPGSADPMPPALCWTEDVAVHPGRSDHGHFQFVQTVGLTQHDIEAMRTTSTQAVVDQLRVIDPLLRWPRLSAEG